MKRILELQAEPTESRTKTVFDAVLNPTKEKGQFAPDLTGLCSDALLFFIAGMKQFSASLAITDTSTGTDTTTPALVTGTWHLLKNPQMVETLQKELLSAIPDPNCGSKVNWATLEKLPYLRAVVKESLRFSLGVPGKLPRKTPATGAVFCGQQIPPEVIRPSHFNCPEALLTYDDRQSSQAATTSTT
jgi:hypothetical protein